ncbi:MAG: MerR family transcriptional regulator, heat shock protein HspR [Actinomycetota bacterium]|jgi:DNA-binding transcriptional MerR regulator|nr:MerR family transcriptional regulator, heat shock protein HspR [Actinomycetota bacterium]
MAPRQPGPDTPIYIISIAAELAGVHPQTLRVYERKGLLSPQRTQGNSRRYSERDIRMLRRIQELTNEGVNLAGVIRILELEQQIERLRDQHERVKQDFEARTGGSLVPFKDIRRVRRAMKSDLVDRAGIRRSFAVPAADSDDGSSTRK